MHSSGVCAHPRGSGCASASYLGSQETPCQSRDSPFLWERFGLARRKPAVRPRAERQQHCLQQCRTDRRPDRQTAPDLGHLLGHRACRGEHGQGRGSCGRVQGHSEHGAGSQCCITDSSTLGMLVVGRRDPALWMRPVGMCPPTLLPSQRYPHAPSACPACCAPIPTAAGTCASSPKNRVPLQERLLLLPGSGPVAGDSCRTFGQWESPCGPHPRLGGAAGSWLRLAAGSHQALLPVHGAAFRSP